MSLVFSWRMRDRLARLLVAVIPISAVPNISALNFIPPAGEALWTSSGDSLECRLVQPIPVFGEAIFSHQAGQPSSFHLSSYDSPAFAEAVYLMAEAPIWKPDILDVPIAKIDTSKTNVPVKVDQELSNRMLAHLQQGMSPVFSKWQWYEGEPPVDVGVSAVNFMPAYRDYQRCLSGLLPLDFENLKASRILFDTGEHILTPPSRQRLRAVAQIIKADPSIEQCYVAGYTDDIGTSRSNMDLSRRRAEAVEYYLIESGVDPSKISTTFHGEANWVSSTRNEVGRAENRRVDVKLQRRELNSTR